MDCPGLVIPNFVPMEMQVMHEIIYFKLCWANDIVAGPQWNPPYITRFCGPVVHPLRSATVTT